MGQTRCRQASNRWFELITAPQLLRTAYAFSGGDVKQVNLKPPCGLGVATSEGALEVAMKYGLHAVDAFINQFDQHSLP
jgi:hypothetical protein